MFWALIGITLAVAIADWWSVETDRREAEYVLKPLTMVVLIGAASVMGRPDPASARAWLIAGLVASLVGDVALMLDRFVPGLAAFLVAHLLYIVAFVAMGAEPGLLALGVIVVALAAAGVGTRIIRGAGEREPALRAPVTAYIVVISAMVAVAVATARPVAIVGAVLFYGSDACIGWSRFVRSFPHQRLAIMITYHLGQIGLVLSLLGTP